METKMKEENINPLDIILPEEQRAMDMLEKYGDSRLCLAALEVNVERCNNPVFLYKVAIALKNGTHGVERNLTKACQIFSKIIGSLTFAYFENDKEYLVKYLETLHRLNVSLESNTANSQKDSLEKLEKLLGCMQDRLDSKLDSDICYPDFVSNCLVDGKLGSEALFLIDELTNPELMYQIAVSYRDGTNGFGKDESESKKFMEMARNYLHAKAMESLFKFSLDDLPYDNLITQINNDRAERDPLFEKRYEAEFENGLKEVITGLSGLFKDDEAVEEIVKECADKNNALVIQEGVA